MSDTLLGSSPSALRLGSSRLHGLGCVAHQGGPNYASIAQRQSNLKVTCANTYRVR